MPRAKAVAAAEMERRRGKQPETGVCALSQVGDVQELLHETQFGSCVFANRPGDGSAREQAASCQKVLGGFANICYEFATKRYRSNCINWGISVSYTHLDVYKRQGEHSAKQYSPAPARSKNASSTRSCSGAVAENSSRE